MPDSTKLVHVYFTGREEKLLMGRLLLKDRRIFFEYDPGFIKTGLQLSPFKLPLKSGVISSDDWTFDGLFGVFNDSLPDGWVRLLLDRKLMQTGINANALSILDRLCFVGNHGMGALAYEPERPGTPLLPHNDFDEIAEEIASFQELDDDRFVDDLLALGGSSAGARPKILTRIQGEDWLVKFRSSVDPKDIGNIEYAYHLMALEAGLEVPEAKLFPSRLGNGYFGVKRFDRKDNKRIHAHTISGLLHADHRLPCLDYEAVLKATLWLIHDVRECEKQFRVALFNVLSHNRDDHAKNFSFLMDENGSWSVSPAYDLTYSSGPNGEHSTMVMGEGQHPSLQHFLKLATIGALKHNRVLQIVDEVSSAVSKWQQFAVEAGVSQHSTRSIQSALTHVQGAFGKP